MEDCGPQIFRLMDEQKQEDEHKYWCDQEIKKSEVMKADKEQKIEMLHADGQSPTGKRENALATEDSKQTQTSVTNAIAALEAFYKESGESRHDMPARCERGANYRSFIPWTAFSMGVPVLALWWRSGHAEVAQLLCEARADMDKPFNNGACYPCRGIRQVCRPAVEEDEQFGAVACAKLDRR